SLLDEWEELATGAGPGEIVKAAHSHSHTQDLAPPMRSVTANERAFTVMVRSAIFRRVLAAAYDRVDELEALDGPHGFGAQRWEDALDEYFDEYEEIGTGPQARAAEMLEINRDTDSNVAEWRFRQVLDDPAGDRDWAIEGVIDLAA